MFVSYQFSCQLCFSELPDSLQNRIVNRYGREALDEIKKFQGHPLKVTFTSEKV